MIKLCDIVEGREYEIVTTYPVSSEYHSFICRLYFIGPVVWASKLDDKSLLLKHNEIISIKETKKNESKIGKELYE